MSTAVTYRRWTVWFRNTVVQFVNIFHINLEHTLAKLWSIIIIIIIMDETKTISKYTSNNRGNWDHVKIIHKIPEQHTGKAGNKETTENSDAGHCTRRWDSTNA